MSFKISKIKSTALYVQDNYIDIYITGTIETTCRIVNYNVFGILLIKDYVKN